MEVFVKNVEIEDITRNSIRFKIGRYRVVREFAPNAWRWTAYLSIERDGVSKGNWLYHDYADRIIEDLGDKRKRTRTWILWNLLTTLSYQRMEKHIRNYFEDFDYFKSSFPKAMFYSLVKCPPATIGKARQLERLVRKAIKLGLIVESKWTDKLLRLSERMVWKYIEQ